MNILVTNDDGINYVGLQTLVKHLSLIGDVYVCAPDSERSAYSHHITFQGKMKIEERQVPFAKKAYALWGAPADCIHCGLQFIFKDIKMDLVVTGINRGSNVVCDAIYSGTVAGAREAFKQGIPSLAMSLNSYESCDYNDCANIAKDLALLHLNNKDNDKYFLNVNVPALPLSEIKGTRICMVEGYTTYDENYRYEDNGIEKFVCLGPTDGYIQTPDGSDTKALKEDYISITPLYCNQIYLEAKNLNDIYLKK